MYGDQNGKIIPISASKTDRRVGGEIDPYIDPEEHENDVIHLINQIHHTEEELRKNENPETRAELDRLRQELRIMHKELTRSQIRLRVVPRTKGSPVYEAFSFDDDEEDQVKFWIRGGDEPEVVDVPKSDIHENHHPGGSGWVRGTFYNYVDPERGSIDDLALSSVKSDYIKAVLPFALHNYAATQVTIDIFPVGGKPEYHVMTPRDAMKWARSRA